MRAWLEVEDNWIVTLLKEADMCLTRVSVNCFKIVFGLSERNELRYIHILDSQYCKLESFL